MEQDVALNDLWIIVLVGGRHGGAEYYVIMAASYRHYSSSSSDGGTQKACVHTHNSIKYIDVQECSHFHRIFF